MKAGNIFLNKIMYLNISEHGITHADHIKTQSAATTTGTYIYIKKKKHISYMPSATNKQVYMRGWNLRWFSKGFWQGMMEKIEKWKCD